LDTLANLWKIGAMMFVVGGTMGENWKELSIDNDERYKLSPRALGNFRLHPLIYTLVEFS
jgi:hypothetical protein